MKLFHFCADHLLESIQREGLTQGCITIPEDGSVKIISPTQWLTEDSNRDNQEWCHPEYSTLPYDRCANLLTVVIPKSSRANLRRWTDCGPLLVPRAHYEMLNSFGDPSKYWLYFGRMPPSWIRSCERLGARWGVSAYSEKLLGGVGA